MRESTIDFVVLWVNGNDPKWREAFLEARCSAGFKADSSEIRYRDWGWMRYWFRAVERFAPWVRKIHLITWGHLPEGLNLHHPKLHIVRHEEYIPETYLPTFNSNPIELNLHRLEDLSEHFVLFNDDTFLTALTSEEDFFRGGLPCDMARLSLVQPSSVGHTIYNNLELINARYSRQALNRHLSKWFSPRYGLKNLLKSLTLLPWSFFPGFYDHHLPQPYLKSRFREAWEVWGDALDRSCRHPFRELSDLSHWLIRYDTLCRGDFHPRGMQDGRLFDLSDHTLELVCQEIARGGWRLICLNDHVEISDFTRSRAAVLASFETLLPTPSSYED